MCYNLHIIPTVPQRRWCNCVYNFNNVSSKAQLVIQQAAIWRIQKSSKFAIVFICIFCMYDRKPRKQHKLTNRQIMPCMIKFDYSNDIRRQRPITNILFLEYLLLFLPTYQTYIERELLFFFQFLLYNFALLQKIQRVGYIYTRRQ